MGRYSRSSQTSVVWLAILFALAGCEAAKPAPQPPPVTVSVAKVERANVPIAAEYVAQMQAVQEVNLVPRVEGVLERVYFKNGSLVRRGQVLMQIQQDQYQADVQAAQGSLDKAEADLAQAKSSVQVQTAKAKLAQALATLSYQTVQLHRMAPLAAKEAVSQEDYDQTKTQYDIAVADVVAARANLQDVALNQKTRILAGEGSVAQAKAQLTNAKLNLGYTTIASPVTGIIGFIKVDEGNVVSPAKTPSLASVSTVDPIKVVFQLSESDYLRVAKRLLEMRDVERRPELQLYLSNGSLYPYKGTPVAINRAINPTTGTITIESLFRDPDAFLRPGQFGRVSFAISHQPNALLIPQTAVQPLQGTTVVYVIGPDNKLLLRTVSTGANYGNKVIVNSGLSAGDEVVVQGVNRVQAGQIVEPVLVSSQGSK